MDAQACWYRVGVKALCFKSGSLLRVKEGSNKWDMPGGGLEHHESIADGLRRECLEELGVHLKRHNPEPVFVGKSYDPHNKRHVVVLYYAVELESEDFVRGDSVSAIEYADISSLRQADFEEYMAPYIDKLLSVVRLLAKTV